MIVFNLLGFQRSPSMAKTLAGSQPGFEPEPQHSVWGPPGVTLELYIKPGVSPEHSFVWPKKKKKKMCPDREHYAGHLLSHH